ncbi:hypothetical protein WCLP8_1030003 [uncultured Gammaproteobacteria bacterium]
MVPFATARPGDFALRVSGNSMNLIYPDGALVLVRPYSSAPVSGRPYVVRNGHEVTLKRVIVEPDGYHYLMSCSSDPEFGERPIHPRPTDRWTVIGEIVEYRSVWGVGGG